jgi:CubicO group peptidase (beta-lactamase class C family)
LVEKAGRLVYEAYFEGEDERLGEPLGNVVFNHQTLHDLRSVSKSVTSALLGIALGGDYEAALATPLPAYFPDLKHRFGPDLGQVTLQHALTMTAGLEWNEMRVPYTDKSNDAIQLNYTEDPVGMVLSRPLRDPPGGFWDWNYNSGLTQVVAGLIERETGMPVDRFAEGALFAPLGITDYEWLVWLADSSPNAAAGLRLTARDLAKFGSLFLHQGRWQGQQIIPAEWIARSTERHVQYIPWGRSGVYGYGFMWYPGRTKGTTSFPIIRATGNGDQQIFILPEQEIVVTIFAGLYNQNRWPSYSILRRILATVTHKEP